MHPYRSVLFVPGHKPAWAHKALASGADAIVLDLEDSVPGDRKAQTRATVRETLAELRAANPRVGLFVRPNALDTRMAGADLEGTVRPGLTGLFTPKIRDAGDVLRWEALADWFETRNGASGLKMIVPVETVEAIENCGEIAAASPRVGAMIGPTSRHADIARAVGFRWSPEGVESLYLRSRILLACRRNGLHALTGLWEDLPDLDGLRSFADHGLQLGFRGQIVIHPSHVPVVNEVFTPTEEDVAYHEELVAAMERAVVSGQGAVRFHGQHIDLAHADQAREWLAHARLVRGEVPT
ncbi:HpcH/HpaI aldolase/citrate lyase family protein [Actinomadura algeriensis]|uniref:Citrate lyase subunit beta/citryl-CoA lyase n=1 Tax=Actinomadura algeriensis TaxID=1679523 RepID=A0ABR9K349_9ACTN|nr:CoA ester lyase [Actinomadura algeriensis]MBE1536956.1 citrate lyase subunit beta/citryl-CoA lyase [Actinomadura algeriensis]